MGVLEPAGLLAGLLALPILALWILRPRRRQRVIGSTLLWRQALDNVQASRPWQRLRWHILLALQLAAIALVALALARPFRLTANGLSRQTFVILDASASMQATDVQPSRFDVAKGLIGQNIDQLPPNGQMTIVLMADEPRVLVARNADVKTLHSALDAALPTNGGANLAAALSLIAPLAADSGDARVLVFSDGGTGDATRLGALPFPVHWIRVGGNADNVAISAFATGSGERGPVALARIVNDGRTPTSGQVELWIDGRLYDVRQFSLAPGESVAETWTSLPSGAQILEARLRQTDALSLDNHAFATVSAGEPAKVLLVTDGNPFLRQALKLMPGVELNVVDKAPENTSADIVVFDGITPATLPTANVLLVHPAVGDVPWSIGADRSVGLLRTLGAPEINRFVDLSQVHVRRTREMTPPASAQTIVGDQFGPLVSISDAGRRRIEVIGFDLHDSDFPLDPSFPVLMSNLVEWLRPGSSVGGQSVSPGSPVDVIPWPAATKVVVVRPDGSTEPLAPPFPVRPIADTNQLGLYRVVQSAPGQPDHVSWFAVNLFSQRESDLTPPSALPLLSSKGHPTSQSTLAPEDLWPWLTAGLLFLLVVEWWAYRRTS